MPLNVITFGQSKGNNINPIITINGYFYFVFIRKGTWKYDYNNRTIKNVGKILMNGIMLTDQGEILVVQSLEAFSASKRKKVES